MSDTSNSVIDVDIDGPVTAARTVRLELSEPANLTPDIARKLAEILIEKAESVEQHNRWVESRELP